MKKLALFASGEGSTIQAVLDAIKSGRLRNLEAVALMTDRKGIGAIQKAKDAGVPVFVIPQDRLDIHEQHLKDALEQVSPDLILLAGYLRKIPASLVRLYEGKIINTHPSLLPKYGGRGYYGDRIHQAVIENGEFESGCTIHYVNEEYDQGEHIAQQRIPIAPSDTPASLAEKVKKEEKKLLIQTLDHLCQTL